MYKSKGHSIMKWWKTMFQNGYKQMDELSSTCRSDTETLRGDEFILTPTGEALHQVEGDTGTFIGESKVQPLIDEEIHCDLSVPANIPERREFAFTLYDFDRAGGVTKDDISGLVQAIFETLGSTLHQSSSGCRTIRVNLTLQPEMSEDKIIPVDKNEEDCQIVKRNEEEHDLFLESSLNSPKTRDGSYSPASRRRRRRKLSSRRQELLEIVRANMERNNLFYPPVPTDQCGGRKRRRKHHCRCYDQTSPSARTKLHEVDGPQEDSNFHCDCCSKKSHTTPASPHSGSHPQFDRSPITHQHSHHYQIYNKNDKRNAHLCDDPSNFTSKTVGNTPNLSRSRKKQLIQFKNSFINVDKSPLENSLISSLNCSHTQHVHQHYHHHYHHPTSPIII